MGNDTAITVRGHAGSIPTLHTDKAGSRWTSFRLACTRSYRTPDGTWREDSPHWFSIRAQGSLAERVALIVRKGTPVLVRGLLREESWKDQEGIQRQGLCVKADSVGLDLGSRGRVTYQPMPRDGEQREVQSTDGPAASQDADGQHGGHTDVTVLPRQTERGVSLADSATAGPSEEADEAPAEETEPPF